MSELDSPSLSGSGTSEARSVRSRPRVRGRGPAADGRRGPGGPVGHFLAFLSETLVQLFCSCAHPTTYSTHRLRVVEPVLNRRATHSNTAAADESTCTKRIARARAIGTRATARRAYRRPMPEATAYSLELKAHSHLSLSAPCRSTTP